MIEPKSSIEDPSISINKTKNVCQIRKSCDACSRAKKKCDGNVPCMNCMRLNTYCKYSTKLKPGPQGTSSTTKGDSSTSSAAAKRPFKQQLPPSPSQVPTVDPVAINEVVPISKPKPDNSREMPRIDVARAAYSIKHVGQKSFGQKEIFFVQLHLRLTNSNFPFCDSNTLSEGVQHISNINTCLSADSSASVALVWCVCAMGASAMHDSSMTTYGKYARDALHSAFDESTDLVARAFYALDIVNHLSTGLTLETSGVNARSRHGLYRDLGEALLASLEDSAIKPETRTLLFQARCIDHAFGSCHDGSSRTVPARGYATLRLPSPLSASPMPHNIATYALKTATDWLVRAASVEGSFATDAVETIMTQLEHARAMASDAHHLSILEVAGVDSDPISYVLLQVSVNLHRMQLGAAGILEATHEYGRLAMFVTKRPLIVSTPLVWHSLRIVLSVIHQHRLSDSAIHIETLGHILLRSMKHLCRYRASVVVYKQAVLDWSDAQVLADAAADKRSLETALRAQCPEIFKVNSPSSKVSPSMASSSFAASAQQAGVDRLKRPREPPISMPDSRPKKQVHTVQTTEFCGSGSGSGSSSTSSSGRGSSDISQCSSTEAESILLQLAGIASNRPLIVRDHLADSHMAIADSHSDGSGETDHDSSEVCEVDPPLRTAEVQVGATGFACGVGAAERAQGSLSHTQKDFPAVMAATGPARSHDTVVSSATLKGDPLGVYKSSVSSPHGAGVSKVCVNVLANVSAGHLIALLDLAELNRYWSPKLLDSALLFKSSDAFKFDDSHSHGRLGVPDEYDEIVVIYDAVVNNGGLGVVMGAATASQQTGVLLQCMRLSSSPPPAAAAVCTSGTN